MPDEPIVPPDDVATPQDTPPAERREETERHSASPEPLEAQTPQATTVAENPTSEFAQQLEASDKATPPKALLAGQRVRGKLVSIGDLQCWVDFGGRAEGAIATSELRAPDGTVLLRVGDPITASVASAEDPITLTLGKKRGLLNAAKLRLSFENKLPVPGVVKSTNKGGFDVHVGGVRAFCPLSQIDNAFVGDPAGYVGQSFTFQILRWENGGRNIVLSRRAILKQEAEGKAVETRKRLEVGAEFDGLVTRVQPFGAFVDIGGLEGLLHVSRMGRGHVQDPNQMLAPGQAIRVRVTRLESPGTGKERIGLEAADLGPDPWDEAATSLPEGQVVTGRVVRTTEFGAFVNLMPGIDGLVHVSEIAPRRQEPEIQAAPPKPGDDVQVKILRVDRDKKRVSLSIRQALPGETAAPTPREARAGRPPRDHDRDRDRDRNRDRDRDRDHDRERDSGGGALTHTMAEQLGALRRKLQVRP